MRLWCIIQFCVAVVAVVLRSKMADNHRAKRARLLELRHRLPYMSQSALAGIIQEAEREPLPTGVYRRDIQLARDDVCSQPTPYGNLHQTVQFPSALGQPVAVEFCAPLPMLYVSAATCRPLAMLLLSALAVVPSTPTQPWHLLAYSDEIVPGNQLSYENKRKCQTVYYSFKEFGLALSDEEAWFIATVVRSNQVSKMVGKMSSLFGGFLKLLFDRGGHDAQHAGVVLNLVGGETVRLFIKFECKVSDESALRQVWMCKGAAGIKLCLLCKNVVESRTVTGNKT